MLTNVEKEERGVQIVSFMDILHAKASEVIKNWDGTMLLGSELTLKTGNCSTLHKIHVLKHIISKLNKVIEVSVTDLPLID